jgi:hypothetical protein
MKTELTHACIAFNSKSPVYFVGPKHNISLIVKSTARKLTGFCKILFSQIIGLQYASLSKEVPV